MNTFSKFLLPAAAIGSLFLGCLGPQCPTGSQNQQTTCPVISQTGCGSLNSVFGQNGSCDLNSLFGKNGSCDFNSLFGQDSSCGLNSIFGQDASGDLNSVLSGILGNFNFQIIGNQSQGNQNQGSQNQGSQNSQNQNSQNQGSQNQGSTQSKPDVAPPETNSSLSSTAQSYIAQVVTLVNEQRAKNGLSALTYDSTLQSAAQVRAEEIVSSFSHTRPDGTYFSSVLKEFSVSYQRCGENIAWGQKTPEEVVTAWMNSSGHRANILNASYTKIGVGCNISPSGTVYWSQLFTN